MSILAWMIGSAGAFTGSAAAALYGITVKAQRPRLVPNEACPPAPYEEADWKSGGATLKGWFMPQQSSSAPGPAIVVAHGWSSNRSRVMRYALPLREQGYSILMYDARSHGDSDYYKTPTGLQFRDDLLSAIDWLLRRQEVDPARIGVIGHSLGAFGAVLALDAGAPIAALVTDSMPVRLSTMIGAELRRRKLPQFPLAQLVPNVMLWRSRIPRSMLKRADPVRILNDNASTRRTPVLLVHSRKDGFIPPEELQLILSRTPNHPHLFVNAEGHSASDRDPAFWPTVTTFFSQSLHSLE
ncbi:alpha/beta hydrolase [Cohnella phaseoli]|uniref:Alpha/beta hydrolase family protein n=1 Tax=Cohnella phaseoli TaxID=456490 RepID=A0A3D9INX4_9BACL|nr:alpha/beta fold hydrolase [Cohnella phaseoli]RED63472.1 alpha/beta hydrolase family protein [Cohnella phaseoli]